MTRIALFPRLERIPTKSMDNGYIPIFLGLTFITLGYMIFYFAKHSLPIIIIFYFFKGLKEALILCPRNIMYLEKNTEEYLFLNEWAPLVSV